VDNFINVLKMETRTYYYVERKEGFSSKEFNTIEEAKLELEESRMDEPQFDWYIVKETYIITKEIIK
jgi:hypothetical protein